MTGEELAVLLKQHGSMRAVGRATGIPESTLRRRRDRLQAGEQIDIVAQAEVGDKQQIERLEKELELERERLRLFCQNANIYRNTTPNTSFKFGAIDDLHFGSLYNSHTALQAFYDIALDQGVTDFYYAGDILDGHKVYKGQEFDLQHVGFENQLQVFADLAPQGGTTHFITGNHDLSFKYQAGINVGRAMESARPDWHHIGDERSKVAWDTPAGPWQMLLLHPGGGTAYSLSYRPQRIIDGLDDDSDMVLIGHYHKAEFMPQYKRRSCLQVGTFERQTAFMSRMGLSAHVGGWIVEVTLYPDFRSIKTEFVAL